MSRRAWLVLLGLPLLFVLSGAMAYFVKSEDDPKRLREAVIAEIEAKRWDQAEAGLKRLMRRGRPTSNEWMLRARIDEGRDRLDAALASLALIPDSDPLGAGARLKEGELELRRHHFRAAEAALRRAVTLAPRVKRTRLNLIYLYGVQLRQADLHAQYQVLADQGPLTFQDLVQWCRNWSVVEKPEETVAILGPVVAADPGDSRSRLVLAEAFRLLGRHDEAEAELSKLPDSGPDARAARVRIALDRGDEKEADTLLADGPVDHQGLARLRGRRALARHAAAEAVRQFEIARDDDRDTLFGLGHALRLSGRAKEAEPLLRKARARDALSGLVQRAADIETPDDRALLMRFGSACEALGRIAEARGWYSLALARDPLDADAQRSLFRLKSEFRARASTGRSASP